jgi:hypothetical protein
MAHRISPRHFTSAALAGGAIFGSALPMRRADAAEFVYKWGTNVPRNPSSQRSRSQGVGSNQT